MKFYRLMLIFCCLSLSQAADYQQIQWIDLMPKEDLKALTEAPIPDNILEGDIADQINSPLSMVIEDPVTEYEKALVSVKVRPDFDKKRIKLPGYIVPIEMDDDKAISFFLVPFFGACIHLPPPPPNQIIYARYAKGIALDNLEMPYWVEATLYTKQMSNEMATAAYSANIDKLYPFKEDDDY